MKSATPIFVSADQEYGKGKTRLVADLFAMGFDVAPVEHQAVDLIWYVEGIPVAFDLKKPSDFIASHNDGRLYSQTTAMIELGCRDYGFIIDEFPRGVLVGEPGHEWTFEAFDEAIHSVERAGCQILHADKGRVAQRIAALYKYTRKAESDTGSWMLPVRVTPVSDPKSGLIFVDKTYRSQVGAVMQTDGYGPKTADALIQQHGFMPVMGITEEGLDIAKRLRASTKGIGPKLVAAYEAFCRA